MAAVHTESIQTNEYKATRRTNMRKLAVVTLLCLMCICLLLLGITRAKYRTPEMKGKAEREAALFNTVLLGELTTGDISALANLSSEEQGSYTLADGKTAAITGRKLSSSLDLTVNNEIGHGNFTNLKPGDEKQIPFTVTNGTTVSGEGQEDASRNKVANVAQSDIFYTLHIRTTENLPLNYSLIDLETGKAYTLTARTYETDSMGTATEYTLPDEGNDDIFANGGRILKWTGDDSITVHRYALNVSWDAEGSIQKKDSEGNVIETIKNTDTRYMKEIENIEVRLEVESYVNYGTASAGTTVSSGIMTLQSSDVDSYYNVTDSSITTIRSQKTVRYDNFGSSKVSAPSDIGQAYVYEFSVQNGEQTGATWVPEEQNDPHSKNGHYEMTGDFQSYSDLGVAIAVPIGGTADVGSNMFDDVSYYIEYDGSIYTGSARTDEEGYTDSVDTKLQVKEQKDNVETAYPQYQYVMKDRVPAYRIIHFANDEGELKLNFGSDFESRDLKLYMVDDAGKYHYGEQNQKDDFRIYIYE